jgi:predicted nucleic acid-binding protein
MRITSKGQVTIPQEIREQCGLLPHTQVRFVDSNVILDVITADPRWQAWSEEQLSRWLDRGPLLINPIIYAEIAFLAARAHAEYRARGGSRQTVLAGLNDAHAT